MKKNSILKKIRENTPKDIDLFISWTFQLSNTISKILEEEGRSQKDLAKLLGKREPEISKWMQGTHNFTLETLAKIQVVLGQDLLQVSNVSSLVIIKQLEAKIEMLEAKMKVLEQELDKPFFTDIHIFAYSTDPLKPTVKFDISENHFSRKNSQDTIEKQTMRMPYSRRISIFENLEITDNN